MKNIEIITNSKQNLLDFIEAIVDDALEAEGCSLELHWPPQSEDEMAPYVSWEEWLDQEAENDTIYLNGAKA